MQGPTPEMIAKRCMTDKQMVAHFEKERRPQSNDVDLDVLVFIRPGSSPVKIIKDENIRINYEGKFIDFRGGMVRVSDENSGEVLGKI